MADRNDGGPAFPLRYHPGMSLRDYFAAHAPPMPDDFFQSWRTSPRGQNRHKLGAHVDWAWDYADTMIRERGRA